jgi:hypothetical protein
MSFCLFTAGLPCYLCRCHRGLRIYLLLAGWVGGLWLLFQVA